MSFEELLTRAKENNEEAMNELFSMYKPLLRKNARFDGKFDENLYQELNLTMLRCIQIFKIYL